VRAIPTLDTDGGVPVRHLMFLLALALAATAATGAPAVAAPSATASGVVLSVASGKHVLRVVEGRRVEDATYRGALPAGVNAGARISFSRAGRRAINLVVGGRVDHVVVFGVVARVGKQLMLRLTDSSLLALPKGRHLKLGAPARLLVRFPPAAGGGNTPLTPGTPTTPATPGGGCAKADCSFDVTGTVTAVDDATGSVTVAPLGGGLPLTAQPGSVNTNDVFAGDFVHVAGTQAAATGVYTLTVLDELPGCDLPDCTLAFDATVDLISPASLTVTDDGGDSYPLAATAAQIRLVKIGDYTHIVAVQDPATGDYRVQTISVLPTPPQ
jgi:hypothetical protein